VSPSGMSHLCLKWNLRLKSPAFGAGASPPKVKSCPTRGDGAQSQEATSRDAGPKPRVPSVGTAAATFQVVGWRAFRIAQFELEAIVHIEVNLYWRLVRPHQILDFQKDRRGLPPNSPCVCVADEVPLIDHETSAELVAMSV
jgi:hypothetical protein